MTAAADPFLYPGPAHPHPPLAPPALGERLGVDADEVARWLADGLPTVSPDGPLIDPVAACNWLCWGHLDRCPLLARRWRSWLRWFQPHLAGPGPARRYRVRRRHRLFLPHAVDRLDWRLPVLPATPDHAVTTTASDHGLDPAAGEAVVATDPDWIRLQWDAPTQAPASTATHHVTITPSAPSLPADDRAWLTALVDDLVAGFRYEYRLHPPAEPLVTPPTPAAGSCLDLARELGRRVGQRRPWRIVQGVVATTALANPHFWIELDTAAGWLPVDPCLPAVARMLGHDWRPWTAAWTGGCDARRIVTGRGWRPLPGLPGGPSTGSLAGEATARHAGRAVNCWPCLDWVCGDCTYAFDLLPDAGR
jgi:hypothetical protein